MHLPLISFGFRPIVGSLRSLRLHLAALAGIMQQRRIRHLSICAKMLCENIGNHARNKTMLGNISPFSIAPTPPQYSALTKETPEGIEVLHRETREIGGLSRIEIFFFELFYAHGQHLDLFRHLPQ